MIFSPFKAPNIKSAVMVTAINIIANQLRKITLCPKYADMIMPGSLPALEQTKKILS